MGQVILYHLRNSRSQRLIWLLEELGCNYVLIEGSDIDTSKLPPEVLPLKFPTVVITHGESTIHMTETSAICEYLCTQVQSPLLPLNNTEALPDFLFWKNFAEASFMSNLALKQVFRQIVINTPLPFRPVSWMFQKSFNKMYLNQAIKEQLGRFEGHFAKNTWLAEEFSIADILNWFPLEACRIAYKDDFKYSNIQAYLKRIQKRPAFQTALIRGNWSEVEFSKYWGDS